MRSEYFGLSFKYFVMRPKYFGFSSKYFVRRAEISTGRIIPTRLMRNQTIFAMQKTIFAPSIIGKI